ncbi:MAG: hypothetical protein KAS32_17690, partial [Candidatus Peribacteraceae bacterium]|nr:hypothetical protein [Candidatus Peribacteraceae bacterium]
ISSNDDAAKIETWLVNKTDYAIEPSDGEFIERVGDIYEVLAKSSITNTEIIEGWNIIPFDDEFFLDLDQEYSLLVKNWGSGYGYNIGYYNANIYPGDYYRAKDLTPASWSGALNRDLAFRTFNGEIAPGSFNPQLNGAPWMDNIVSETDEVVWEVKANRVYGETIEGDDWWLFNEGWDAYAYNFTHRYAEEIDHGVLWNPNLGAKTDDVYYTYVSDIVVYVDGVPLCDMWDYEYFGHPAWPDDPVYGWGYEYDVGVINIWYNWDIMSNYTKSNVTVDYTYFNPGVDIAWDPIDTSDNIMLPMKLKYGLVTDLTLKKNGFTLVEGPDFTLNPVDGTIILDQSQQLGLGDVLTADYDRHSNYMINMTTGNLTFAEDIEKDTVIDVDYSYYHKYMDKLQLSIGKNAFGTGWMISDAYIDNCDIIMDGTSVVDPSYYTLNSTTGTITLLKPLLANNTYAANFEYYRLVDGFLMGAGDADWNGQSVITGTPSITKNGLPWLEGDTTFNIATNYARIEFNQTWNPLPPNIWINGSFDWYPYLTGVQLEHGSKSDNSTTTILPNSQIVYNLTVPMIEGVDYTFDSNNGTLQFLGG